VSVKDTLGRRVFPRAIVALSTVRLPWKVGAAVQRALGRRGTVRLFVAFDDPASAVALLGLVQRLAGRRVDLVVEPVVARGIPGDPAVDAKKAYAVVDSRRLALRDGLELTRSAPIAAADVAFLAEWAAAVPAAQRTEFAEAAMHQLWFASDGPVNPADFAGLLSSHEGSDPPPKVGLPGERGMKRRRLYDTPVAVFAGQWFFAHERLPQIEYALDELGWTS
jgi:2-hydroxychromene-2-carboxylate isomerase